MRATNGAPSIFTPASGDEAAGRAAETAAWVVNAVTVTVAVTTSLELPDDAGRMTATRYRSPAAPAGRVRHSDASNVCDAPADNVTVVGAVHSVGSGAVTVSD
jgi:hypothetical protein